MIVTLGTLRDATLAARARRNDKTIGTRVDTGRVQVVRVTYIKGGRSVVEPLSDWLSPAGAVSALNALQ